MRLTLCILLLCFWVLMLPAIEVSGYISEDTTWTIEDSPYMVTGFLYIDAGATLTIMPGVEIRVKGGAKDDINNFDWVGDTEPQAKMIVVYGKLIACGTVDMPITFDVHNNDNGYCWGGIHIHSSAPESLFEYCVFKRTFFSCKSPTNRYFGALQFDNGLVHSYHNSFVDNHLAMISNNLKRDTVLYDCKFYSNNDSYPAPYNGTVFFRMNAIAQPQPLRNYKLTIANCYFTGKAGIGGAGTYMDGLYLNCVFEDCPPLAPPLATDEELRVEYGSISQYGNTVINGSVSHGAIAYYENDVAFCRRNTIIKYPQTYNQYAPITIGGSGRGTVHVCDNYLEGAVQIEVGGGHRANVSIYNNVIKTGKNLAINIASTGFMYIDNQINFFNNLVVATNPDILAYDELLRVMNSNVFFFNNSFSSFSRVGTNYLSDLNFFNNIFHNLEYAPSYGYSAEHPNTYGYNSFNIPLPSSTSILDVGGNILADSCFVDAAAGDYTLKEGFAGIDNGLNLPELPAFDIRYHERITDGVGDISRRVDMGAYEYNSEYIGGIKAFVYDAASGKLLDCVKAQIAGKLPEFSDSLGYFVYPTGAGTYNLTLSRWDYETLFIENIVVLPGEELELNIALQIMPAATPVGEESPAMKEITLWNYPNPFNPETRISYNLPEAGKMLLNIYNLKGQKLICLAEGEQPQGAHSLIWNGKDENGKNLPSGIYFARLVHNGMVINRKMILMK